MVTGKFIRGNDDLREVEDVRMRVFVEEQGFRAAEEMDAYDARAIHCLLYDGEGKPAATASTSTTTAIGASAAWRSCGSAGASRWATL